MKDGYNCAACGVAFDATAAEQANYRCPDCGTELAGQSGNKSGSATKITLAICALLALGMAGFLGWQSRNGKNGEAVDSDSQALAIEQTIKKALEINAKTPLMIDKSTRLDQVLAEDKTIIYKATLVNFTVETADKDLFNKEIGQFLSEKYCTDKKALETMAVGINYGHEYFGSDGALLYRVNISFADC